jgi:hypothetical protein
MGLAAGRRLGRAGRWFTSMEAEVVARQRGQAARQLQAQVRRQGQAVVTAADAGYVPGL